MQGMPLGLGMGWRQPPAGLKTFHRVSLHPLKLTLRASSEGPVKGILASCIPGFCDIWVMFWHDLERRLPASGISLGDGGGAASGETGSEPALTVRFWSGIALLLQAAAR